MKLIYSNVPPLKTEQDGLLFTDYFAEQIKKADTVYCVVGYASKNSLIELDRLVRENKLKKAVVVLGMYCIEGFPESIYNTVHRINKMWVADNLGEIRATKSMKYHGKVYGFSKDGILFSAAVGSNNLGTLVTDANNRRQYELSIHTESREECEEIYRHIASVITAPVSDRIDEIQDVKIIREENTKLNGVEGVIKITAADVESYKAALTDINFNIPIKVPGMPKTSDDYMKSNMNKCYAKGRLNTKTGVVTERSWWETEVIVSKEIRDSQDYPKKDVPFYVITDDGWKFLAHASGDQKKNLESHGDLKILGYWLKGRLVAAGIVEPVDSPAEDLKRIDCSISDIYSNCRGVVSYEKLLRYGRTSLTMTKTSKKMADDDGNMRDVWLISFLPKQ